MIQRLGSSLVQHKTTTLAQFLDALKQREYLTYKDYGAVLDGVTDDTDAIIATHSAANAAGVPVVQFGGSAYVDLTKQIVIQTPVRHVGFTLNVDKMSGRGIVISTPQAFFIDPATVTLSEFIATRTTIPSLAQYANHHIVISSTETDLNRKRPTGLALQTKAQPIIVGKGGVLNAPLWSSFGSISEMRAQPLTISELTVEGLTLSVSGNVKDGAPIGIQRNNVRLIGCTYRDAVTSETIPIQSLVSVEFACNVLIEDMHCDALAKDFTTSFNYVVNVWKSSNVTINRLTSFDGWAQVDGNYFRGLTVNDSTIDRVGGHFRCYDATFTNLSSRRGRCIEISGGGNLKVENIKVQMSTGSDDGWVIGIRGDYGAEWDGNVDVSNVLVDATGLYSSTVNKQMSIVSALVDSTVGAHDFMRAVVLPRSIQVSDCKFMLNNMQAATLRAVAVGCTSAIISDILYPESVTVDNVTATTLSSNVEYKVAALHLLAGVKVGQRRQHLTVNVSKVKNLDPALYNKTVLDDTIGMINYTFIGSQLSSHTNITDCPWSSLLSAGSGTMHKFSVKGGSVGYLSGATGNQMSFTDVTFNGTRFRGAFTARIMSCVFANYIDYQGTSIRIGNGANIDAYVSAISGTVTEVGQSLTSTTITPAVAWSGWKGSAYQ